MLMTCGWSLNGSCHPHVVPSYTCPSAMQSVVCPVSAATWWKRVIVDLCSQRMTRSGRRCHFWINLAGTPKGTLSTFMNFWRKWLASLNPRYFLIEVESLWPTWREKPLSTPHPVFRIHQPTRARKSRMGEQNHASWKSMHSGKGLRSSTGFTKGLSIISHFRFKFWIAFSQDYCWTPWLSSILEFELVIKKKQPTYKEVMWKMVMFCVHLWLTVYDETE